MSTNARPLVGSSPMSLAASPQPLAGRPPPVVQGMRATAERLMFKPSGYSREDVRTYLIARDPLIERDAMESTVDQFLDVFADMGLTDGQASALMARARAKLRSRNEPKDDDAQTEQRETLAALRKRYGADLARLLDLAQRLVARDGRFAQWVASAGLGNDEAVVIAMIEAGERAFAQGQPAMTDPGVNVSRVSKGPGTYIKPAGF